MSTLSCADFSTRKWQRLFKKFIKVKAQLWKTSYIGNIVSDQKAAGCVKTAGVDDKWDDKMASPTSAPVKSRRLGTDNTLTMTISATGTPLSTITNSLSSIKAINLPGYPPSAATVTATQVSTSTSGSARIQISIGVISLALATAVAAMAF
jgi:hypothetical protein